MTYVKQVKNINVGEKLAKEMKWIWHEMKLVWHDMTWNREIGYKVLAIVLLRDNESLR